ncbi:unnamed protein product [Leuciscus chuanchicus]
MRESEFTRTVFSYEGALPLILQCEGLIKMDLFQSRAEMRAYSSDTKIEGSGNNGQFSEFCTPRDNHTLLHAYSLTNPLSCAHITASVLLRRLAASSCQLSAQTLIHCLTGLLRAQHSGGDLESGSRSVLPHPHQSSYPSNSHGSCRQEFRNELWHTRHSLSLLRMAPLGRRRVELAAPRSVEANRLEPQLTPGRGGASHLSPR